MVRSESVSRGERARVGVACVVIALLLLLARGCQPAPAQTTESAVVVEGTFWAQSRACYNHTMTATAEAEVQWGAVFGEGFVRFRWWGACDTKARLPALLAGPGQVIGSMLNAESAKVNSRRHGVNAGVEWRGVQVGATVRRRAVHHVWRHRGRENRHGHFPSDDSAIRAMQRCRAGKTCPGIGYEDGVRPYVGYEGGGVDMSVVGPLWSWKWDAETQKGLTLPWPDWVVDGDVRRGAWVVGVFARAGGPAPPAAVLDVERQVVGRLHLGASIGRDPVPGWKTPKLDRVALRMSLR